MKSDLLFYHHIYLILVFLMIIEYLKYNIETNNDNIIIITGSLYYVSLLLLKCVYLISLYYYLSVLIRVKLFINYFYEFLILLTVS